MRKQCLSRQFCAAQTVLSTTLLCIVWQASVAIADDDVLDEFRQLSNIAAVDDLMRRYNTGTVSAGVARAAMLNKLRELGYERQVRPSLCFQQMDMRSTYEHRHVYPKVACYRESYETNQGMPVSLLLLVILLSACLLEW